MSISSDYLDFDSVETSEMVSSLKEITGDDTWIKVVDVIVHFQVENHGRIWKSVEDRLKHEQGRYSAAPVLPDDFEILRRQQTRLSKYPSEKELQSWIKFLEGATDLFSRPKYEEMLYSKSVICDAVRDRAQKSNNEDFQIVLNLSPSLQRMIFPNGRPKDPQERAARLSELRREIQTWDDDFLFQKIRDFLPEIKDNLIRYCKHTIGKRSRLDKILQLPLGSEEMRTFIAQKYQKLQKNLQRVEEKKIRDCYRKAMNSVRQAPGMRTLSKIEVAIVFAHKSNLSELSKAYYQVSREGQGAWAVDTLSSVKD